MKSRESTIAMVLLTACALSASAIAQENTVNKPKHHHYKLVDIGTFGGPQSFVNPGSGNETGNYAAVLNSGGAVAGWAETSTPDPFPAFCFTDDCVVAHAFELKNGAKADLGAFPGGASSAGNWISSNGLIAGFSQNGEIDPLIPGLPEVHGALWAHGRIIDLGTLPEGGFESIASAVNSRGQVAGVAINTIPDPNSMIGIGFQTRAFFWQDGAMEDLGTLGTGTDAQAILINEKGQVVGWSYVNSVSTNACNFAFVTGSFIWDKENGMRDLGSLGGSCTTASDMNSQGQVVGFSNLPGDAITHGFLWDNGSFQDLGGSLGGDSQGPFALNEHGEAVGVANLLPGNNSVFQPVLWKHVGNLIGLLPAGSVQCGFATSINAKTQVVGTFSDCGATGHVFLWEDGSMVDLNALIPSGSALHLEFTETINDLGEIAGTGVDAKGNEHAFLAIPCDQNHPGIDGCDYHLVGAEELVGTTNELNSAPVGAIKSTPADAARWPTRFLGSKASSSISIKNNTVVSRRFARPNSTSSTVQLSLSPTSLTFSTQAIGTPSPAKVVTLQNTGTTSLTITTIAIAGTNAGDFVQTHTCGSSLTAGAGCTINVMFKPSASGTRTAALSITDNAAGSPQRVPLSGIGTTAKLSPTSVSFGTVAIGTTTPARTVTLTNVGTTSLTISGITIAGANAGDFGQTHTCGGSLAAGITCTISITFKPTASGTRTGALSVADNAAGSPQEVSLGGIGTTSKLFPTSLNFGTVTIGTTSPAKTVTLTNVGTTTMSITGITITGINAGDFGQTHTCGSSLAAGATCSINIIFKPTARGTRTASLSVSDNAAGSPQAVSLMGNCNCIPPGGICYGPGGNHCCPAPYPHHSFCSDPTGFGTCTES